MIKIDRTGEFDVNAAKAAIEMYEKFVRELVTALFNTKMFAVKAYEFSCDSIEQKILRARIDAFEEILERIEKERDLARQELDYAVATDDYTKISQSICFHKNLDVENLLPEDKFRGRRDWWEVHRFKGKIANLLEGYAQKGFNLGVRYDRFRMKGEGNPDRRNKFDRAEVSKMIGLDEAEEVLKINDKYIKI